MSWTNPVPLDYLEQAVNLASQEFIKGFLAGQLALLLLLFIIIKFFFLRGHHETKLEHTRAAPKPKVKVFNSDPLPILESVQPSTYWLNLFIYQIITNYRNNIGFQELLASALQSRLNESNIPAFMDRFAVAEISLGDRMPILENISVSNNSEFIADVDWIDNLSVNVDTSILFNWPKLQMASLPINLQVNLTRTVGNLHVRIANNGLVVEFLNVQFEMNVQSLLGNRTKVKDLPKVASIALSKIKKELTAFFSKPFVFKFPKLSESKASTPKKAPK